MSSYVNLVTRRRVASVRGGLLVSHHRMEQLWPADRLRDRWSLLVEDAALLLDQSHSQKLGCSIQLAFWRQNGRFPDAAADVAPGVIAYLADQTGTGLETLTGYAWTGLVGQRHRRVILRHLAVVPFDGRAAERLRLWLIDDLLPRDLPVPAAEAALSDWFVGSRVSRPRSARLDGVVLSAESAYDEAAMRRIAGRLGKGARERLDALLVDDGDSTEFTRLSADPSRVGVAGLLAELGRLERMRALAMPADLLRDLPAGQVSRLLQRAVSENTWVLRRSPEPTRLALLALWCAPCTAALLDNLVDMLVRITHRITVKAERRVEAGLGARTRTLRDNARMLLQPVQTAARDANRPARADAFANVGAQTLVALAHEARMLGAARRRQLHAAARASYAPYYRRVVPKLLTTLEFHASDHRQRPLLAALDTIVHTSDRRQRYRVDEVAIEGVIPPNWRDIVDESAPDGRYSVSRVSRVSYEICALRTMGERLRDREVWVTGAARFGDPDGPGSAGSLDRQGNIDGSCIERVRGNRRNALETWTAGAQYGRSLA